jgi:hypothetical protein
MISEVDKTVGEVDRVRSPERGEQQEEQSDLWENGKQKSRLDFELTHCIVH